MRIFISMIALFIVGATALQLRGLWVKRAELQNYLETATGRVSGLVRENATLQDEIDDLSKTENLIREAKAQFNYAAPGEKLIILVPKN